ncbi:MAG TPA: TlpA disulfide reductase family protein [Acidobacteriaceae bacterium]|nr:TlpA disulfide reductase family protein [Acidobacteriaceae bacterium]
MRILPKIARLDRFAAAPVLLFATMFLFSGCDRGRAPRQIGRVAPPFTIHDGSEAVTLRQYRGQVVLLNFWASWCPPCIEELPSLMALHRRMPQLVILGVSIDEDAQAYHNFLLQNNIDFPTIREPSRATQNLYGTVQIPESYVIDKSGHIVRKYVSAQDWTNPEILQTLSAVLNEKS